MLGGLGGIVFITAGVSEWRFEYGVAGFGFLSLAVMIFGQWKPTRIALAALLFGLFRALSNVYAGFEFLKNAEHSQPRVQHDALHHLAGGAGLHLQEVPRTQSRGYPLRQGSALTRNM